MTGIPDELVEKAARAVCVSNGLDPDEPMIVWSASPDGELSSRPAVRWEGHTDDARVALEAVGLPALLEDNEQLRVSVNRQFGEALDEVYKTDGITIVMQQIHDLRREKAALLERVEAAEEAMASRETERNGAVDIAVGIAADRNALAAKVADALAAYEAKVQDFAIETWVVSEAHKWASAKDSRFSGDLADVGVDRGRWLAKEELSAVLTEARQTAPARAALTEGTNRADI